MTPRRCAECGRELPGFESGLDGSGTDASLPLLAEPHETWGSFDGRDLCPECQTPDQRREADRRLVDNIEREVERRQSRDEGPDPYEAALVAYAMALRARLDADPAPVGRPPAAPPAEASAAPGAAGTRTTSLRVAYTAAFLTGQPLPVRLDAYGDMQRKLSSRLREPQWSVHGLNAQGGTYETGGGLSEAVPLVIARRNGSDLLASLPSIVDGTLRVGARRSRSDAPLLQATPDDVIIHIYDLGVAVMTAWYDVVAVGDDLKAVAEALRRLAALKSSERDQDSPLAVVLQRTASATAEDFATAVRTVVPGELPAAWLSRGQPSGGAGTEAPRPPDEGGRLLWLHPVYVLDTPDAPVPNASSKAVDDLTATFSERIEIEGGVFVPGIGSSVVAAATWHGAEDMPIRLTELHWAYYALYLAMDRGLLGVLDQQRWSERAPLGQLEADAEAVFADYLRVTDARAKLDSALSALGGDELAVWETIAKVQRFEYLVAAVGRKVDALEKVATRRVTQATTGRARRMGDLLGALSVLTLITVTIALISELLGARGGGPGPLPLRVGVVLIASVGAGIFYWLVFIRTAKIPSGYPAGRSPAVRRWFRRRRRGPHAEDQSLGRPDRT